MSECTPLEVRELELPMSAPWQGGSLKSQQNILNPLGLQSMGIDLLEVCTVP